uniref:Uncharacterized protein n=1 Tax=Pyxicephalus adspersus TaxID=30357 RepID=A0AAV2ZQ96_PYXAD|nr:TPA: hypothetical protein GDO54_005636 [Pyxicephalus adspersus]
MCNEKGSLLKLNLAVISMISFCVHYNVDDSVYSEWPLVMARERMGNSSCRHPSKTNMWGDWPFRSFKSVVLNLFLKTNVNVLN